MRRNLKKQVLTYIKSASIPLRKPNIAQVSIAIGTIGLLIALGAMAVPAFLQFQGRAKEIQAIRDMIWWIEFALVSRAPQNQGGCYYSDEANNTYVRRPAGIAMSLTEACWYSRFIELDGVRELWNRAEFADHLTSEQRRILMSASQIMNNDVVDMIELHIVPTAENYCRFLWGRLYHHDQASFLGLRENKGSGCMSAYPEWEWDELPDGQIPLIWSTPRPLEKKE